MKLKLMVMLAVVTSFGPFSLDLYLPGLPDLRTELAADASTAHLTVTACIAGLALGQLCVGLVPERFGRRPPMLAGMTIWIVATLACAAAPTIETVMAFRLVQGFGAGIGMAVVRVVIADLDPDKMARHVSRMMLILAAVPVLAPSLGAVVLSFTDWRGVFVLLAVIGVGFVAAIWRWLPESHPVEARGVAAGGARRTVARYGVLLRNPRFLLPVATSGAALGVMFSYIGDSAFVFRDGYGFSEMQYGVLFGVNAVALIAGIQMSPVLAERIGPRPILLGASAVGSLGAVAMVGFAASGAGGPLAVAVALGFVLFCAGSLVPLSTAAAIDADLANRAVASGLMGAAQFGIGGVFGALPAVLPGHGAVPLGLVAGLCLLTACVLSLLGARRPLPTSAPLLTATPHGVVSPVVDLAEPRRSA